MNTDPRRGVPSASVMHRISACPGSWELSKGLPNVSTADSTSGDKIHKALETGDYSALDPQERETFEMIILQMESVLAAWPHTSESCEQYRELRLGMTKVGGVLQVLLSAQNEFIVTGQADYISVNGRNGIIIDYKTGRGKYEHAEGNEQLRTLAVLASKRFRLNTVRVAIIQPWAGKPTVADFDKESLADAKAWLLHTLDMTDRMRGTYRAGHHCDYCLAKQAGKCETWKNHAAQVHDFQLVPSDSELAASIEPDKLAEFDVFCRRIIQQAEKAKAWIQSVVLDNPDRFSTAYSIEESEGRDTISSLDKVWSAMEHRGVALPDFLACLTARKDDSKATSLPGLKGALRRATGIKGKELDSTLEKVLDGCIVPGNVKRIAVRIEKPQQLD